MNQFQKKNKKKNNIMLIYIIIFLKMDKICDYILYHILDFDIKFNNNNTCLIKNDSILKLILVNKRFFNQLHKHKPLCKKKICFAKNIWCSLHNHYEYKLAKCILIQKKIKDKSYAQTYLGVSNNLLNNEDSVSFHISNKEDVNLKEVFTKVTNDSNIVFSHTCCQGKGIMFYI